MGVFGNPDYVAWRRQRIDALLAHAGGDFFREKRVLELGGGGGEVTEELLRLGARVTMLEAREGYVEAARARCPTATVFQYDLDRPLPEGFGGFDVVVHMGLLYHLGDPLRSVREACAAGETLILETEVVDSTDPWAVLAHREDPGKCDDGVGPVGTRLSYAGVERALRAWGFTPEVVRVPDREGSPHLYCWEERNDGSCRHERTRRMWLARRR